MNFQRVKSFLDLLLSSEIRAEVEPLEEWSPVPTIERGTPDYSSVPPITDIIDPGEAWKGITEPDGGILNLTILKRD